MYLWSLQTVRKVWFTTLFVKFDVSISTSDINSEASQELWAAFESSMSQILSENLLGFDSIQLVSIVNTNTENERKRRSDDQEGVKINFDTIIGMSIKIHRTFHGTYIIASDIRKC